MSNNQINDFLLFACIAEGALIGLLLYLRHVETEIHRFQKEMEELFNKSLEDWCVRKISKLNKKHRFFDDLESQTE